MKSKPKVSEKDDLLAAEYAMGTLPQPARVSFEARLADDVDLQQRTAWWHEKLMPMSDEIEPLEAPSTLYKNIENQLFKRSEQEQSWWHNLGLWRGLAIVSLAGILVLGSIIANINPQQTSGNKDVYVAQLVGKTSDLKLVAFFDASTKTLKLNRLEGKAAQGRDFELWLIPDKEKPISLGVLPSQEYHVLELSHLLKKITSLNSVFAISDEPKGGSPTGQVTGAVLALGKIISM